MTKRSKLRRIAGTRHCRREVGVTQPEMEVNKWLDLPRDSLSRIFSLLDPIEVILVVPLVCKYWGRIFVEHFFWKQDRCLDFTPLGKEPLYSYFCRLGDENSRAIKVMKFLVGIMHSFAFDVHNDAVDIAFTVTPIMDIKFPFDLPLYDRHIVYVAERSPELRSLSIPCAENLTGRGISRAMRGWSKMEQIVYGPFRGSYTIGEMLLPIDLHLPQVVEELGVNCRNLQYLSLFSLHFQRESSVLITSNLKSLKILMLENAVISKYGLQLCLSRCKNLKVLDIRHCESASGGVFIDWSKCFVITRHQEGRRRRWCTDIYPDRVGETFTPRQLVKLMWQPKRYLLVGRKLH